MNASTLSPDLPTVEGLMKLVDKFGEAVATLPKGSVSSVALARGAVREYAERFESPLEPLVIQPCPGCKTPFQCQTTEKCHD